MEPGLFITFEGIDGAGKTSHIQSAAVFLQQQGFEVVKTREPGGTQLAEKVRDLIIHEAMPPETEALLLYAARYQHVQEVIKPALAEGKMVLSDRFEDSTFAYQAHAGGLSIQKLQQLSDWAMNQFKPDCTYMLDLPLAVSMQRRSTRKSATDKFEEKPTHFMQSVREGFLEQARLYPERIQVIDASIPEQLVWEQVRASLAHLLTQRR